jgi:hypothetical protein
MELSEIAVRPRLLGPSRPLYEFASSAKASFSGFSGDTAAHMNKIDTLRNIDGRLARFLRFGNAGFVVVSIGNAEREIETAIWIGSPTWSQMSDENSAKRERHELSRPSRYRTTQRL